MANVQEKAALLIIDAQKGFMDSVFDVENAVNIIKNLVDAAREASIPIIYTQEMHRKERVDFGRELDGSEGIHCLEGTDDVELIDGLSPQNGEYIIKKRRYSCFFATDLEILLKGLDVNTLIVCGFLTDVCVHYTCVDAHQHDYHVKVVYDGVRGSTEDAHHAALKAIKYLQKDSEIYSDPWIRTLRNQVIQSK
ncbi:cysteine hydrolase family protein [Metabacillus litoralis]|uniref:cysteine hydrolase family protein n=1 Tax=Metabacillus litoralis TaxID=152268 RepID=UPI002040470B|nr:isochorismatase family cysteine hydrolase [Metabacillus litoralis]MCM3163641.1 cysteine hydrolase [Metabacillus litoralis]